MSNLINDGKPFVIPPSMRTKYDKHHLRDAVADHITKAWYRMNNGLMRSSDARSLATVAMNAIKITAHQMKQELALANEAKNDDKNEELTTDDQ